MISFTTEETLILLEAARIALSDAEVFDQIADGTDMRDRQIAEVRDKLTALMGTTEPFELNVCGEDEALVRDGEFASSYILAKGSVSAWILVDSVSVCITRCDEGVSVDLRPSGAEDAEPVGSTWATFAECKPDPADNDEFVCTTCKKTFDIDDSVRIAGELHCVSCAQSNFDCQRPGDIQKIPCPGCGTQVAMPSDWNGQPDEAVCNQCNQTQEAA